VFPDPSRLIPLRIPRRPAVSVAGALLFAFTLVALLSALPIASAQAASTGTCPSAALSQPFAGWGDTNFYALVPGGDFEGSLSGWTLSGGAKQTAGSEPFAATGTLGTHSLALPVGASVQTPAVCVSSTEHTFRFFARSEGTGATVLAQVIYGSVNGSDPGKKTVLTSTWGPSTIFHTGPLVEKGLAGSSTGTVQVALRITSLSGTARIDDLFQDPRMRR